MAQGTDYTQNRTDAKAKEDLLIAVTKAVFRNDERLTQSDNIQRAIKDAIETLWSKSSNIETTKQTYINIVDDSKLEIVRESFGSQVRINGIITNTSPVGSPLSTRVDISDVLPQNFLNKKWFKLSRVTTIIDETAASGGSNGYLEIDEVSSYLFGSIEPTPTLLFIPGNTKGATRSYDVDGFNASVGVVQSMTDRIESSELDNYINSSPKDLTLNGLNISFLNAKKANDDYGVVSGGNSGGYVIRFMLEGYLF